MEQTINTLSEFIKDTQIHDHWGGYCVNNLAKPGELYPYGIKIVPKSQQKTNVYTYSDKYKCSGYLFISNLQSKPNSNVKNAVQATITIYTFTNPNCDCTFFTSYERVLALYGILSKVYKNIRLYTPVANKFQEFTAIDIIVDMYAPCEWTNPNPC